MDAAVLEISSKSNFINLSIDRRKYWSKQTIEWKYNKQQLQENAIELNDNAREVP